MASHLVLLKCPAVFLNSTCKIHLVKAFAIQLTPICSSILLGFGAFFNDSIHDHERAEYLSGYIGSALAALRYGINKLKDDTVVFFSPDIR